MDRLVEGECTLHHCPRSSQRFAVDHNGKSAILNPNPTLVTDGSWNWKSSNTASPISGKRKRILLLFEVPKKKRFSKFNRVEKPEQGRDSVVKIELKKM